MDVISMLGRMLSGSWTTILLFIAAFPLSLALGMLITLGCRVRFRPLQWVCRFYIYVFRGTPLLLQMLILFYGVFYIPGVGSYLVIQDRFAACVVAFTLNYAAYFAEIFRGGFLAVDKGQTEAAQVLGLGRIQTLFRITFPQMFRVALPSVANETITLVKDTSLIFAIGIPELLQSATNIVNKEATFLPYVVCALFYLVLTTLPAIVFRRLEKKFDF